MKLRRVVLSVMLIAAAVTAGGVEVQPAHAASFLLVPSQYPTIKAAIAAAVSGDTVVVAAGTYHGGFSFRGKDITLAGASRNLTRLDFDQGDGLRIGPRGTITGFTLLDAYTAPAVLTNSKNSVIRNNTFVSNRGDGLHGTAIGGSNVSPIIDSNIFWANECDDQFYSAVVSFSNGSQPVIRNNQFVANECRAITMNVVPNQVPVVTNNTIVANRAGVHIGSVFDTSSQIFRNNLIVENTVGFDMPSHGADPTPTWTNNLVFGNDTNYLGLADPTGTNGNISTDPGFVNEFAVDHHLAPGSAAIDAGTATDAPPTDFDGTARPVGVVDIGAFEYSPGTLPEVFGGTVSSTEGNDGSHNVTILLRLSMPSSSIVSVNYLTIDDSAASSGDYTDRFGILDFQPGQVSRSVTVPIRGDRLDEADEDFWVVPYFPLNATIGSYPTIHILDDDPQPALTAGNALTAEGDSGGHAVSFPVQLSQPSGRTVHVTFTVVGATARPGTDFVKKTGTVTFAPGQARRQVTVWVKGDTTKEPVLETFTVRFSNPVNTWIPGDRDRVTGTIVDDD